MISDTDPSASNNQARDLLSSFSPFDRLPAEARAAVEPLLQVLRYRAGQTILRPDVLPEGLYLLRSGQVRSLAANPLSAELRTIEKLLPGALSGWCGILRDKPCEHLRASTEVEMLRLPATVFRELLDEYESIRLWFQSELPAAELHQLLVALHPLEPEWLPLLESWSEIHDQACVFSLSTHDDKTRLSDNSIWYVSSGAPLAKPWSECSEDLKGTTPGRCWIRLVGLPRDPGRLLTTKTTKLDDAPSQVADTRDSQLVVKSPATGGSRSDLDVVPVSSAYGEYALSPPENSIRAPGVGELRLPRASGPRDIPIALVVCLTGYFGLPLNRDSLRDQVDTILEHQSQLNLINIGQILDNLGLQVVLSEIPYDRLARCATPAVLYRDGHFAVLDGVDEDGLLRLLEPELGPLQLAPEQLANTNGGLVQLLLLQRKPDAKEVRFSWSWYLPFLREHRRPLTEVVILSSVVNILGLAAPLGSYMLMDQVARQKSVGALITISALLLIAALLQAILQTLRSYILAETANRLDLSVKSTILNRLVRLPQSFFDGRPVGRIMFYFGQLDRLREFLLGQNITTAIDFCFSIVYVIVMLMISVPLTLATLSTLPLVLGLAAASRPLVRRQVKRTLAESSRTFSFLNESISGIQTLKSQNAELKTRWEFQARYARFAGEDFKLRISKEALGNLANFIDKLNSLVMIGVGVYLIMTGKLSFGGFIAFRMLSGNVTRPLIQLVQAGQQLQQASASIQMVADVVDRPVEQSDVDALNITMPEIRGAVRFDSIQFSYEDDQLPVLDGIDLEIQPGSFVGIIGGSGCGKTTLLKLLPRFYLPNRGKVLIDGFDISKVELYSLRRQIGVVPQDTVLFDGSIRENLLLVKPDATADEMMSAARVACAHDFIMAMPKGYNSDVGERGASLSGGQRQRLALARAVLQNPRMLILDEATSALDARTERQVCMNLLEAFRGRTVFLITHRLASVQSADAIVFMDKGAVMEVGTHAELIKRQGWYYALYHNQGLEGVA